MKKKLQLLVIFYALFILGGTNAQTTFNTAGDWSNAGNWSSGIPEEDCVSSTTLVYIEEAVTISANCTISGHDFCGGGNDRTQIRTQNSGIADFTIDAGATLDLTGGEISSFSINSDLIVNGTVISPNFVQSNNGVCNVGTNGLLNLGSGNLSQFGASGTNDGTIICGIFRPGNGNYTNNGTIISSGIIPQAGSGSLTNNGIIKGTGVISNSLGGTIEPGNSVGTMTSNGNNNLSGTVNIEVASPSSFDQINATNPGTNTLTIGTLHFIFTGAVTAGQTLQIFSNFTSVSVSTISAAGGYTLTQVGSTGSFTVTNQGALPVELVGFSAEAIDNQVQLKWITASEQNNRGFDIERSKDGITWETIAFIEGTGNTTQTQSYDYRDATPHAGINYYRLKQIDIDGAYEYSNMVSVNINSDERKLLISPNPIQKGHTVNLQINFDDFETGMITLYDMTGKIVLEQNIASQNTNLDISRLSKGIYIAALTYNQERMIEKLLID